jgi:hypothetical protein
MPPELHDRTNSDDIDRELEKLRGFGSTLLIALSVSAGMIAAITLLLWWAVF